MKGKRISALKEISFWILFGGIWLLTGIIFLIIGAGALYTTHTHATRIQESQHSLAGTVLVKSYNPDNSPVEYKVRYRFVTPEGQRYYGSSSLPASRWDQLKELGPVRVLYSPADPETNQAEGAETSYLLGIIFAIAGGVVTIIGAVCVIKGRK
jgi:hypothetical protein